MRFRTDEAMEAELDELEALLRGAGYRHMNRSAILRALVAKGLSDLAAEAPKPAHEHGPFVGTPLGEACHGCGGCAATCDRSAARDGIAGARAAHGTGMTTSAAAAAFVSPFDVGTFEEAAARAEQNNPGIMSHFVVQVGLAQLGGTFVTAEVAHRTAEGAAGAVVRPFADVLRDHVATHHRA
jgi:ferredoxin